MNLAKIGEKNPNFGKVHSAESKAKMSVARGTAILYTQKITYLLIIFLLLERLDYFLMFIVKLY
jgi:hypothetical protein